MRIATSLFRDGFEVGPLIAVQDHFGKLYHWTDRQRVPGSIIKTSTKVLNAANTATGELTDNQNWRFIAAVDRSEVCAVLRKIGLSRRMPKGGQWWECISD